MSGKKAKLARKFAKTFGYTSKSVLGWYKQQNSKDKNLITQDMENVLGDVAKEKAAINAKIAEEGKQIKENLKKAVEVNSSAPESHDNLPSKEFN